MSSTTSNLELFKYNTTADASTPFSITNALNNNWDKIDTFAGTINTLFNGDLSSATGKTLFSDINTQLGQKLEAEVLLEENGYIKFNSLVTFLQKGRNFVAPIISMNNISYIKSIAETINLNYTQTLINLLKLIKRFIFLCQKLIEVTLFLSNEQKFAHGGEI